MEKPILNIEMIDRLRSLATKERPNVVLKLLESYISNSKIQFDSLQSSFKNNEETEIYKKAHALKSGALTLGLEQLAQSCQELENVSKANPKDLRIVDLNKNLVNKYELSIIEVKNLIEIEKQSL